MVGVWWGPVVTIGLMASAFGAAQARAVDAPIVERPVLQAGDSFDYVDRFQTIACKHWEITGRQGDAITSRCGDTIAFFAADSGALLRVTRSDGTVLVNFDPAAPAIPFPLQIGSKWGGRFQVAVAADLITPKLDERCEVLAYETIHIAAGELAAFRFDCVTKWSVWPLSGTVTVTSWYAPAAKSVVKSINPSDSNWDMELAAYRLQ
jgi:hypothetical protein